MSTATVTTGVPTPNKTVDIAEVEVTTDSNAAPIDHDTMTEEDQKALEASGLFNAPVSFRTIPVVHELPPEKKKEKNDKDFMFAEHGYLGDTIELKLKDGSSKYASDYPFNFYDGALKLTYGQINGLAGDFYGTYDPICKGDTAQARTDRFRRAFNTLAENSPEQPSRQPGEIKSILQTLQEEVDKINAAIKNGVDPSTVYEILANHDLDLQGLTITRPSDQPSYFILTSLNLDHFGENAQTAYNTGHAAALDLAKQGDLDGAYALNAFADHFLEDRFSAGHLRTPRPMLSGRYDKDLCSMYMHDEDNAIGLSVENPRGDKWRCYGDKRLADSVDKQNLQFCREAVQKSANEIYDCWKSKTLPSSYGAWQIAPTLASANSKSQECCPLFEYRPSDKSKEWRRKDIDIRRKHEMTDNFWYATTLICLAESPRFKYPITLDP